MPSSTAPLVELNVALPLPALTESIDKLPLAPITTGPAPAVTEVTVTGVAAASLIHTPPLAAAAVIVAASTHRALLALPELVAESTVTEPAVTFGCAALDPPTMPSVTAPVAELKVALLLPALIESLSKLPLAPIT